jgi:uncharacterized membrane protein (DUF2068 family)
MTRAQWSRSAQPHSAASDSVKYAEGVERAAEPGKPKRSRTILTLIGILKLLKSMMLVLLAIGAFKLVGDPDVRGHLLHWVNVLGVDPHGKHLAEALEKLGTVDARHFTEIGIGSLIYAAVFAVEGIGLLLAKTWAEVLTVIITTSFIPLEVYEMIEHKSITKGIVIAINIGIVVYLVLRLHQDKIWPFKRH